MAVYGVDSHVLLVFLAGPGLMGRNGFRRAMLIWERDVYHLVWIEHTLLF